MGLSKNHGPRGTVPRLWAQRGDTASAAAGATDRPTLSNGAGPWREAGTGKEQVARALHGMSHAASGPFVVCHGAALEEAVAGGLQKNDWAAESSDALNCLTRMAQRGTLFLDGSHEMPLQIQLRLLRLLRRHDSTQNHPEPRRHDLRAGLRMIAATSENLKILASAGRFQPGALPADCHGGDYPVAAAGA